MRTAIYVRVSTVTHSQQHTIEEQVERLRASLLARGEAQADEHLFRDEGRSGATLNRPALDRSRDGVRLGDYDRILVTSPDRLARNYVHQRKGQVKRLARSDARGQATFVASLFGIAA